MVFHTDSPSEINAIQRVNTCSDIQDNIIVKGMGKLSMPVVPGNPISLPNFLSMHSVQ